MDWVTKPKVQGRDNRSPNPWSTSPTAQKNVGMIGRERMPAFHTRKSMPREAAGMNQTYLIELCAFSCAVCCGCRAPSLPFDRTWNRGWNRGRPSYFHIYSLPPASTPRRCSLASPSAQEASPMRASALCVGHFGHRFGMFLHGATSLQSSSRNSRMHY